MFQNNRESDPGIQVYSMITCLLWQGLLLMFSNNRESDPSIQVYSMIPCLLWLGLLLMLLLFFIAVSASVRTFLCQHLNHHSHLRRLMCYFTAKSSQHPHQALHQDNVHLTDRDNVHLTVRWLPAQNSIICFENGTTVSSPSSSSLAVIFFYCPSYFLSFISICFVGRALLYAHCQILLV